MAQVAARVTSGKDALKRLGSLIILVAGIFQFFVGISFIGMVNTGNMYELSYVILFIAGLFLIVISIISFAYDWINFKLNPTLYTVIALAEIILTYFVPPSGSTAFDIEIGNTIGLFGVFFMFIALRPNFGPIANKKIYQAVAGIMAFVVALIMAGLGLYVLAFLNIGNFAGRGTYPGDFVYAFIDPLPNNSGVITLNNIHLAGTLMLASAGLVILIVVVRNIISLKVASIGLLVGIIFSISNMILFSNQWNTLDNLFYLNDRADYTTTLILHDPGVVTAGTVLIVLYAISFLMMIYASFAAKPIMQWRRKRDSSIAAAEVFFREGKLLSAIKYLDRAAQLSSKIDEEDKAVELLTRIKQIKDKSTKMRKAEQAEKQKKKYEADKKKEAAKKAAAPKKGISGKKGKQLQKQPSEKDKEIEEKMRKAMEKKDK